jgi:hypothetical protein
VPQHVRAVAADLFGQDRQWAVSCTASIAWIIFRLVRRFSLREKQPTVMLMSISNRTGHSSRAMVRHGHRIWDLLLQIIPVTVPVPGIFAPKIRSTVAESVRRPG